ncbi:MAG: DUF1553 domain-containing protein, partial [Planctomycetaceae bacterium]|nr:DUF1553 domain-containing protein [Planctomycetaceae bacterium]
AFRYRDYVVKSLNDDKPFDQFVREQLAGDLLVTDEMSESQKHELLIGTGFLSLGPKVLAEADKTKMLMDILDEQINTTGVAFMGLTFGCARCHNHKFDPISQADYYSMVGIFKSTYTMESLKTIAKWHENSVATEEDLQRLEEHKSRLEAAKAEIASTIQTAKASLVSGLSDAEAESRFSDETRAALKQLRDEQKQLEASVPELPTAMGVKEGSPETSRINIRGSHLTLGRPVRRDVPAVLRLGPEYQIPETASGRLQFANWLVDPQHPLTARVMVNRVWRWHFGRGIVASTDNFGHLGDHPTHPKLLDWLACELMDGKWSLKSLHRTILLSHTWQQSSESNPAGEDADPANHLLWRSGVHRLDAESIRDSILAVSDRLDRTMGGSLLHVKNREFLFNHTSKDETRYDAPRRSIYLPLIRNNIYDGFSLFDCTDAAVANGNRSTSTVASQALFMMNSELLIESAEQLARVTLSEGGASPQERIDWLFGRTMGRPATAKERNAVIATLQTLRERSVSAGSGPSEGESPRENSEEAAWAIVCQSLLASNEFIYVR